jgi:hypothetical protein
MVPGTETLLRKSDCLSTYTVLLLVPTITGGTNSDSSLTLRSTSGNGTPTGKGVEITVGNNGETKAVTVLNNGNTGFGETNPLSKVHATGGGLRQSSEVIVFDETSTDNTGLESASLPVTGQSNSVWVGYQALWSSGGSFNTAVGSRTLQSSAGSYNSAVGQNALSGSDGSKNSAVGRSALQNAAGSENNAMGNAALLSSTGSYNNAVGNNALRESVGSYNAALGQSASYAAPGSYNTALGADAGYYSGGTSNLFLGAKAGKSASPVYYTNAIAIGPNAVPLGNNSMVLGNAAIVTNKIFGSVILLQLPLPSTAGTAGMLYTNALGALMVSP